MDKKQNLKDPIPHGNVNQAYALYHTCMEAGKEIILYLHWHEEFELLWIKKGRALFYVDQNAMAVEEGDVLFMGAGKLHQALSLEGGACEFYAVVFSPYSIVENPKIGAFYQYVKPVLQGEMVFPELIRRDEKVLRLLGDIMLEEEADSEQSHLIIRARLMEIWNHLFYGENTRIERKNSSDPDRWKDVIGILESRYGEDITLAELAKKMALSESQFSRLFKQNFGMSAFTYLLRVRIQRACELLRDSQIKISQIAGECGFGNISHFNRVFQTWVHCTPKEYRKSNGAGQAR